MPNPLSWYFHHLPKPVHKLEVAGNHVIQVIVPFALFAPQPIAGMAGSLMLVHQSWLVFSGNFSWLNIRNAGSDVQRLRRRRAATSLAPRPRSARSAAGLAPGGRPRDDRADRRPQLLANPKPDFTASADERQLQPPAPGEHLRRLRQHHQETLRGDPGGDRRTDASPNPPPGRSTSSRANPAIRSVALHRWRPTTSASIG